jgi:hypothetical protein
MFSFDSWENRASRVNFEDIEFDVLEKFVQFIYLNDIEDWNEYAFPLLILADRFNYLDLGNNCEFQISQKICGENVVEFLLFCKNNAHFCEGVKEACLKYLLM